MIRVQSLPKICVALAASRTEELVRLAYREAAAGEHLIELRLDMLEHPEEGVGVVERLHRRAPHVVILATCRRRENQGEFDGSIKDEIQILRGAVEGGAQLVDLEIESAEFVPAQLAALREEARVVLSYHNFEKTPSLGAVLKRLRRYPADIYKIATMATQPSDNVKLLGLLGEDAPPLIVLGMGEYGAPSRILSPGRGAAFSFAASDATAGTAPGQLTVSRMRNLFQVHKRNPETKVFGVIADPIGHSLSPALHNRAFRRKRVDACYLPFYVEPGKLGDYFKLVESLPVEGFSVTIPHKRAVMKHLDEIDPLAERIGAVNTVYRKDGKLCGTNTDAIGVTAPLEKKLKLNGAKVLVVGTGGAARAAAFALADKGAAVTISGRDHGKASRLAKEAGVASVPFDQLGDLSFAAMVQSTPVGMAPHVDDNLFPGRIPADIVFDMVYNPLDTALLRRARELDKAVILGLEMFIEQASAQFEIWTGIKAPRVTMRNAVLEVLTGA